MSLRLERIPGALLARAALKVAVTLAVMASTAAMLALYPAAAEAQTPAPTEGKSASAVVVRPGDSLWSISEGLLGPNASPRRVMEGVERIHALNRSRIGADPNLVLVGQELALPPAMSRPSNAAPAREAAGDSGSASRDRTAGPEGKGGPGRRGTGLGAVPRSGMSPEEAGRTVGAGAEVEVKLPEPRAAAPVPAARPVAPNGAQPRLVLGFLADASAEDRRRLLGLGIVALTLVAAVLVAARSLGAARREARKRDLLFRTTYGSPYSAPASLTGPEGAPRPLPGPLPGARDRTAYPEGPASAGAAPETRSDLTDPFVLSRAKRARARRRPPETRARGLRRSARARGRRRTLSGRRGAARPSVRQRWEPDAALVGALGAMTLPPGTGPGGDLARLRPLLEEALEELGRLERLRGLSDGEKSRREALRVLMAAVEGNA